MQEILDKMLVRQKLSIR